MRGFVRANSVECHQTVEDERLLSEEATFESRGSFYVCVRPESSQTFSFNHKIPSR